MRGLILLPIAAVLVAVAVLTILYADGARLKHAPIARRAKEQTLDAHLRRLAVRLRPAWNWFAAWAWWTRVTVSDALRRLAVRLRPAWNWFAAWAWWTRVTVGDALRQAAQRVDSPIAASPRLPDEMTVRRRRIRPRSMPRRTSTPGLGDREWTAFGRFSASPPIHEWPGPDDADDFDREAPQRKSA